MHPNLLLARRWTAAISLAATIGALTAPASLAARQAAPADTRPRFEAATIKPAAPDALRNQVMPTGPTRLSIPSMTLSWLIYTAYGDGGLNTSMRVTGGPDWVNRTPFAVEAVAPGKATSRELRLMLQTLLEERFALKLRVEMTTVEVNTLVLMKPGTLGPKVQEWDGTCRNGVQSETDDPSRPRCPSGYIGGRLLLDGATMFAVAEALSLPQARGLLGGLTQDQTGLTGRYTMALDFPFAPPRPTDPAAPPPEFGSLSLSTAIQEQWGMRLVRGQGPFRLVTIESAQQPTSN